MSKITQISKILSANDVGDTGGHQAGILVPKDPQILGFFPHLDPAEKNPRVTLSFFEDDGITCWKFNFIYYNNRLFGGTRNEYRLTCMTKYLRARHAVVGDAVQLSRDPDGRLRISLNCNTQVAAPDDVIILSGGWKVIRI